MQRKQLGASASREHDESLDRQMWSTGQAGAKTSSQVGRGSGGSKPCERAITSSMITRGNQPCINTHDVRPPAASGWHVSDNGFSFRSMMSAKVLWYYWATSPAEVVRVDGQT